MDVLRFLASARTRPDGVRELATALDRAQLGHRLLKCSSGGHGHADRRRALPVGLVLFAIANDVSARHPIWTLRWLP